MTDPYLQPSTMEGLAFSPLSEPRRITAAVSPLIREVMDACFQQAELGMFEGGTPVGAGLLDTETGVVKYGRSKDKVTNNILDHAEIDAYLEFQSRFGSRLGRAALITTTEPCPMCTSTYAQGDIGTIIFAARRQSLRTEEGKPILRERKITMANLLDDSKAQTNVYYGYQEMRSVKLWQQWHKRQRGDA